MDRMPDSVDQDLLTEEFDRLVQGLVPLFARSEARERARGYLRGLLSAVPRKNSWQMAEEIGDTSPYGIQNLLGRASWSADQLRDHLRDYAISALADPQAVLILDETGFLKKGKHSAGVARQYSGTAGRVENCQVGVFLAYRSDAGCALIDRELYLPQEWTADPARCRQAGVPAGRTFLTKIQLAAQMLQRVLAAGIPFAWVTGDNVYSASALRTMLEQAGRSYVLASDRTRKLWQGDSQRTAEVLAGELHGACWRTITLAFGSKGQRRYRYARMELNHDLGPARKRWLLVRESLCETGERSYYLASGPGRTSLTKLAGHRWSIEMAFEETKGQVGLDEYEVRSFEGWQRHITLSLLAHALLVILRSRNSASRAPEKKEGR